MEQANVNLIFRKEKFHNEMENEEIVAYTANMQPLNRQQYIDSINEARRQIKEGKFITHEECMKKLYAKYNVK
jgi:predicted transcriptional regulator